MARDRSADISRWYFQRLRELGVPVDRAVGAALAMRETFGGKRIYIRMADRAERPTARATPAGDAEIADAARGRL